MRIPVSTYRLQFNRQFGFKDAQSIVSYLHRLGISDLYASPLLKARSGSSHGYDVADPTRLNPELGTEHDFDTLSRELKTHEMGLLLDIVPNHMAASVENPWWMDVLENGQRSPYAPFFDIDWTPDCGVLRGKILLPVLGGPYSEVLEGQELTLKLEEDGIYVHYYGSRLPINIHGYASIASHRFDVLESDMGADHPEVLSLSQILMTIDDMAQGDTRDRPGSLKAEMFQIFNSSPRVREHASRNIDAFNGKKGVPASFNLLDGLLSRQFYQLAFWRSASEGINYRRFFDISDLAGVRVEDLQVFESAHSLIMSLVKESRVSGLRLDHIDGLYDPLEYLQRLQSRVGSAPGDSAGDGFYVAAEKILAGNETLSEDWPVAGTTGYDFLNALNSLFVSGEGIEALRASYTRFIDSEISFSQLVYEKKRQVILDLFPSEIQSLSHRLALLASNNRYGLDISRRALTDALIEITAILPIYRTYVRSKQVSISDRAVLENAAEEARRNPKLDKRAISFIQRVLLLDFPDHMDAGQQDERLEFVMRWQQFTGPVMAKGVEDTALYSYNCLISLNDVGGEPGAEDFGIESFHSFNRARGASWPHTMSATSTHDTKRSEDVRARLNVLSEIPREWERRALRWSRWNEDKKVALNGALLPDHNTEWLIYQTMIGAWPLRDSEVPEFKERLKAYVVKASREAKELTSWFSPDEESEVALTSFVDSIMEPSPQNRFLEDFQQLQKRVAFYGAINSLSQVLLKATSPGIPDFYQGTELWDFSLVDPDNRRPVDFNGRSELLNGLIERAGPDALSIIQELLDSWDDGRMKLYLTHKALSARNSYGDVFAHGEYIPLKATGTARKHVCAFARRHEDSWALSAAPRLITKLCESGTFPLGDQAWRDDALILLDGAPILWLNVLTNERLEVGSANGGLRLSEVFSKLPVALLVRGD